MHADTKAGATSGSSSGDEFRFAYVNWQGIAGHRRVRASGLDFAADGTLVLAPSSVPSGEVRTFAVDTIRPSGRPAKPGVFTFSYMAEEHDVPEGCGLRFGSTKWHPTEQLLYAAFDLDKGAVREFAVSEISPEGPRDGATTHP